MTDCFALLGQPRRPWLDAEALKQRFLALSAETHPDRLARESDSERRAAQERFTALNSAYNCLRQPKERLRHLLELELGAPPRQLLNLPAELMELSLQVGALCREADSYLPEKKLTTSPLLQVQLFQRGQDWLEKLQALRHELSSRHEALVAKLKELDARWAAAHNLEEAPGACDLAAGVPGRAGLVAVDRASALQALEQLYRLFGFYSRWTAQVEERIVLLSV